MLNGRVRMPAHPLGGKSAIDSMEQLAFSCVLIEKYRDGFFSLVIRIVETRRETRCHDVVSHCYTL